ncbi:hypothetical protein V866_006873 [Kwoniella sp. B9012]
MAKPSNHKGDVVPARTYRRYLEDFYHHFVKVKAEVLFDTEIVSLIPQDENQRGWVAQFRTKEGEEEERSFDKVVLATGYLGKPFIPDIFKDSTIPTYHTSALGYSDQLNNLLNTVSSSTDKPAVEGDEDTILVVGGGKSGMDTAALLANRGKKVIWTFRGPLKWFAPTVPPGMMGANRLDIMFGPSRIVDSWTMWFYHCTFIGARWVKAFWKMMRLGWTHTYIEHGLPPPGTDPYLSLAHFAGGIPSSPADFLPLLKEGRIAMIQYVNPKSINSDKCSVDFMNNNGEVKNLRCGAIVTATGYSGGTYDFMETNLRKQLGLVRCLSNSDVEINKTKEEVLDMRKRWKSIDGEEYKNVRLPLVFRGILPYGRFEQRDLAITGATMPFYVPAITYEAESHWISSLFKEDPFFNLPKSKKECLEEIKADNNFTRARYPGIDPYECIPSGTYFSGFNDLSYTRVLLRDMSLDPWRQKSNAPWWKFWSNEKGWLDVRVNPEQYATLGEERRGLREHFQ